MSRPVERPSPLPVADASRLAMRSLVPGSAGSGIALAVLGGTALMGGKGSIIGSAIGAVTLGVISNGLVLLRVDVYWVPITQGLILIVAILLNAKLFGRISGQRG